MEKAEVSLIRYVTRIHFADRVLEDALPEELRARRLVAPLIIADVDAGPALARLMDCLPANCWPRLLDLSAVAGADAMIAAVQDALDAGPDPEPGGKEDNAGPAPTGRGGRSPGNPAMAGGCDAVIGLGGRLALDLARIIPPKARRSAALPDQSLPTLLVPTLPVGLGLVTCSALASALVRGRRGAPAVCVVPDVIFCDPSLLQPAAPARLAVSGMDALIHCLEALLSTTWNPPADGMAADGLRRAGDWLERLVADPHDATARREVLAAALNGALAAQKGFGAIHALSHAIEIATDEAEAHGTLHGALVGPVLAFNAPAVPERMAAAAEALRLPDGGALAPHLAGLAQRVGLPARLSHLGLTPARIARIASVAVEDRANRDNPRHATASDYRAMLSAAL